MEAKEARDKTRLGIAVMDEALEKLKALGIPAGGCFGIMLSKLADLGIREMKMPLPELVDATLRCYATLREEP